MQEIKEEIQQIIEVGIRVRPHFSKEIDEDCCIIDTKENTITVKNQSETFGFDFITKTKRNKI